MSNISAISTLYCLQLPYKYNCALSEYWFQALMSAGLIEVYKQKTTYATSPSGLQVTTVKTFVKLRYKLDQLCNVFVPKDSTGQIKIQLLAQYQEPIAPSWYVCPLGQLIKQFGQEA